MTGEVSIKPFYLIDRGDPAAADFAIGAFTIDGAYHDLDLSAVVPTNARWVYVKIVLLNNADGVNIALRTKSNSNTGNTLTQNTQNANFTVYLDGFIYIDPANPQTIQYNVVNVGVWTTVSLIVRGWAI